MVHAKGEASMQGAPGVHLGTVDHIDGEKYIKLTKSDSPDGQHQWIPVDWVAAVNGKQDSGRVYDRSNKREACLIKQHTNFS